MLNGWTVVPRVAGPTGGRTRISAVAVYTGVWLMVHTTASPIATATQAATSFHRRTITRP